MSDVQQSESYSDNQHNNTLIGFLTSFKGRVVRKNYWLYVLFYLIVFIILVGIDGGIGSYSKESNIGLLSGIFTVAAIWPGLAVAIKRLHDRDMVGWWVLVVFVPFIGGLILLVICGFLAGTDGENRFGPQVTEQKPFGI